MNGCEDCMGKTEKHSQRLCVPETVLLCKKVGMNSAEVFPALEHADQYTDWTGYERK